MSTRSIEPAAVALGPGTGEGHGHPSLQHQFDSLEQQKESSTLGMWLFLVTEIMFFGGLFTTYVVYRSKWPWAFAAGSHHLDVPLGLFNTVVLIGSSLTMAMAIWAGIVQFALRRRPDPRVRRRRRLRLENALIGTFSVLALVAAVVIPLSKLLPF